MKKPGIAVLLTLAAATLFAASSPTAKAPPGTDNVAFGYGAGYGSGGQNENVVCIGTDAGAFSSNNVGCVFIGANAGQGVTNATRVTDINGHFYADQFVAKISTALGATVLEYTNDGRVAFDASLRLTGNGYGDVDISNYQGTLRFGEYFQSGCAYVSLPGYGIERLLAYRPQSFYDGNLARLDEKGNLQDAGFSLEFKNGSMCVYTNGVAAGTLTFTPAN